MSTTLERVKEQAISTIAKPIPKSFFERGTRVNGNETQDSSASNNQSRSFSNPAAFSRSELNTIRGLMQREDVAQQYSQAYGIKVKELGIA